jgi:hypothetical protein
MVIAQFPAVGEYLEYPISITLMILTEWNFKNANKSCPVNDETRAKLVQMERQAFQPFVEQGRLAAARWYTWNGDFVGEKENPGAIFRCGALTDAGKQALSPM